MSSTPANTRSAVSTEVKAFAIVPLHSAPSDAVAEINSLYDVYLDVQQKWDLNVSPPAPCLGLWGLHHASCPGPTCGCLLAGHHVDGRFQR